ncbi:hypothetical protein JCGZ_00321 [Jatropha curcas]|uniref:Uncharacterized protein n=1 Tax=Jatropha curcas TaxID=180498 RepID=A0A067JTB0_JATCU|nr:hypothetical protein JCGZ_00321 [Jatropha curcas]
MFHDKGARPFIGARGVHHHYGPVNISRGVDSPYSQLVYSSLDQSSHCFSILFFLYITIRRFKLSGQFLKFLRGLARDLVADRRTAAGAAIRSGQKVMMLTIEHPSHRLARISLRNPFLVLVERDQPSNWPERAQQKLRATIHDGFTNQPRTSQFSEDNTRREERNQSIPILNTGTARNGVKSPER